MTKIDRTSMETDLSEHLGGREGLGLLPRSEHAQLKTFIVEAHGATSIGAASERLERAAADVSGELTATADPSLWLISASVETEQGPEPVGFWVDLGDPRFWLLHAKTNATPSASLIKALRASGAALDVAWLPRNQLRSIQHLFNPSGFRLGFDERPFYRGGRQSLNLEDPTHKLNVEHAGVGADQTFDLLAGSDLTRRAMAVSEVAFWDRVHENTQLLRLNREGRLMSTGDSLDVHLQASRTVLRAYSTFISRIELTYGWSVAEVEGELLVEGRPLALSVEKPEGFDFEHLVTRLVSGVEPFRILGSVEWAEEDLAWVEAIDLHTGSPLRMDLTPEWFRVYIEKGVCGNTLARFVTNLQRAYSADLKAFDPETQSVLGELAPTPA